MLRDYICHPNPQLKIAVTLHIVKEMRGIAWVPYCVPDIASPSNVCCSFCLFVAVVKPSGHHLKLALKMHNFAKAMFKPMRWGLNLHLMSTWFSSNNVNSFLYQFCEDSSAIHFTQWLCVRDVLQNIKCLKRLRNIILRYIINVIS